MIARSEHLSKLLQLLRTSRIVALLGVRQGGKTTLAKQVLRGWKGPTEHFDLERPEDLARLAEPMLTLEPLRGLVIIDEVQHRPNLFPVLRVLADKPRSARFLILGSASPVLLKQGSETLAGRIAFHQLPGFSLVEAGSKRLESLWLRGGLPRSILSRQSHLVGEMPWVDDIDYASL